MDSFELVFEHGIVDGHFLKVVNHDKAPDQKLLEQFARIHYDKNVPWIGLNVAEKTCPYPCQIIMRTVYGDVRFVYDYADGRTVGDVEMLRQNLQTIPKTICLMWISRIAVHFVFPKAFLHLKVSELKNQSRQCQNPQGYQANLERQHRSAQGYAKSKRFNWRCAW